MDTKDAASQADLVDRELVRLRGRLDELLECLRPGPSTTLRRPVTCR